MSDLLKQFNQARKPEGVAPLPKKNPGKKILMDPDTGELSMGDSGEASGKQKIAIQQIAQRGFGSDRKVG